MTRAGNAVQGRINQSVGGALEAWAQTHFDRALSIGVLVYPIEHNEAHTKILGGNLRYVGKGIADYTGLLANDKTIGCEAKSTDKDYLPKKVVKKKQADYLDAIGRKGHVAILLVEFRVPSSSRFVIPWLSAPWKRKRTAMSIDKADLDPSWRIKEDENCFLERFCTDRVVPVQNGRGGRIFPRE